VRCQHLGFANYRPIYDRYKYLYECIMKKSSVYIYFGERCPYILFAFAGRARLAIAITRRQVFCVCDLNWSFVASFGMDEFWPKGQG